VNQDKLYPPNAAGKFNSTAAENRAALTAVVVVDVIAVTL